MTRRSALRCLPGLLTCSAARSQDAPVRVEMGGGAIDVTFTSDQFDLPRQKIVDWVALCARAVSGYFGRYPVSHASLEIQMAQGRRGVSGGVTNGDGGARTRIRVGQRSTEDDLKRDWILTHEFVHYGFPSMDRDRHWIEEGSATYVEPIARAAIQALPVEKVWGDMVRDMPQGLPGAGDQGLDRTHTWGRTYWGGALFCLLADVRIRQKTQCAKGLVDALRAINRAGGNVANDWPIERALQTGDKATGGKVLMTLYGEMGSKPMEVDLPDLWRQLGVERQGNQVTFHADAPLARVRSAISS
ncbi:MAG: hypothetical protein ABSF62_16335 [Bryobacteraceae bacterium]